GRYQEAEPLFKRALAIREKALGPEHPDTAGGLNNLALLFSDQGCYEEAEPLYKRALAIREKVLGPEHPHTPTSLTNLASLTPSCASSPPKPPTRRPNRSSSLPSRSARRCLGPSIPTPPTA